jgi:hypothetical protein
LEQANIAKLTTRKIDDAGRTVLPSKSYRPHGRLLAALSTSHSPSNLAGSPLVGLFIGGSPALMTARPPSVQKMLGNDALISSVSPCSKARLIRSIEMDEMDMGGGQVMLMAPSWTPNYAALIFLMWAIMMVAMMLPSAGHTILLVAALARGRNTPSAGPFTLGYLLAWISFSLAATALQWGLDSASMLSATMATSSATIAGEALIAAGTYQWRHR